MNIDFERFLNTGSIMLTLYAIAAMLFYIAFLRPSDAAPAQTTKVSKV